MYCPQCGQQQASGEMRFCSRCGFPLGTVAEVVASGGLLPSHLSTTMTGSKLSARQKGIRQGAMLMLSTMLVVPLVAILASLIRWLPGELIAVVAVSLFAGGLLRIFYALILEDNTSPLMQQQLPPSYVAPNAPAQLGTPAHINALPPQSNTPATGWRRADTAELVHPPSVTENTTRLLDEDPTRRLD